MINLLFFNILFIPLWQQKLDKPNGKCEIIFYKTKYICVQRYLQLSIFKDENICIHKVDIFRFFVSLCAKCL